MHPGSVVPFEVFPIVIEKSVVDLPLLQVGLANDDSIQIQAVFYLQLADLVGIVFDAPRLWPVW